MQPPIELLRQYMDMGGWYGRDNSFRSMVDVQFVAAMGTPGGGRTFVTDRYLRHYNLVALSQVGNAYCATKQYRAQLPAFQHNAGDTSALSYYHSFLTQMYVA